MYRYARMLGLSSDLRYTAEVPPDAHGRPGVRCRFPSRPAVSGRIGADHRRTDFQVILSRRGSVLLAVCSDRTDNPDSAAMASERAIRVMNGHGIATAAPISATRICGTDAVTYEMRFFTGILTEWKLVKHGWLYMIGLLHRDGDRSPVFDLAMRCLDTWDWLPPEANRVSTFVPDDPEIRMRYLMHRREQEGR